MSFIAKHSVEYPCIKLIEELYDTKILNKLHLALSKEYKLNEFDVGNDSFTNLHQKFYRL